MSYTKGPAKPAGKMPALSARIDRLIDSGTSKVRAIASVNIGDAFAVHSRASKR